jgi:hypothetical protein
VAARVRRRQAGVGPVVAGVVAALAACGSTASPGASHHESRDGGFPAVLSAYTKTTAARTAKIAIDESVRSGAEDINISGSGVVGFKSQTGALALSVPSVGTIAMRIIPPELYMQLPVSLRAKLPPGKTWLSLNLNTLTRDKLGASLSQLSGPSTMPTQVLGYLQAVSTDGLSKVGPARIRGVATTEYRATVDLTKVAARRSTQARVAIKVLETELHRSTMPVQLWIDGQGRARQFRVELPVPSTASGSTSSGSLTVVVDLYDFGTPLHVQAPQASVIDNVTGRVVKATA